MIIISGIIRLISFAIGHLVVALLVENLIISNPKIWKSYNHRNDTKNQMEAVEKEYSTELWTGSNTKNRKFKSKINLFDYLNGFNKFKVRKTGCFVSYLFEDGISKFILNMPWRDISMILRLECPLIFRHISHYYE